MVREAPVVPEVPEAREAPVVPVVPEARVVPAAPAWENPNMTFPTMRH